jgi:hypothetical protein
MVQDRLSNIREYFQSLEQYEGKWVVCVNFKPKWCAYSSENGKINAIQDENVAYRFWYIATDTSVSLDNIIDLIEETINTNIDAFKKAELFQKKASELKVLFSSEEYTYNDLLALKFVFDYKNESKPTDIIESVKQDIKKKAKAKTKKDVIKQLNSDISNSTDIPESVVQATKNVNSQPKEEKLNVPVNEKINEFHETRNASDLSKSEIDDLRG